MHRELAALVQTGLTPYEALRTGTVNAARHFNAEDEFGRLAPGLAADLVWLDGNPLADIGHIRRIRGVMYRGCWLSGQDRRYRLTPLERSYAEPKAVSDAVYRVLRAHLAGWGKAPQSVIVSELRDQQGAHRS